MRFLFILFLVTIAFPLQAAPRQKERAPASQFPPQEHFRLGLQAESDQKWGLAASHFLTITEKYPQSTYAQEAYFHQGRSLFAQGEYERANSSLTLYLQQAGMPKNFEESIELKYRIAEQFRKGAKTHLFGYQSMPKWQNGKDLALDIYDEVTVALPNHPLAANALYSKAMILWNIKQYKEAVASLQKLIQRFPKDDMAPVSYVCVANIYLDQATSELQNADILAFSEINLKHFEEDFPRDERISEVKEALNGVKEMYAKGLFETGQFYEKVGKYKAAAFYYRKAISDFPETGISDHCRKRLNEKWG